MSQWTLVFYETAAGRCPVREYLAHLDDDERAKVTFDMEMLAAFGLDLMNLDEYIAEEEKNNPAFREARERLRPQFEFRKAMIAARLAAGLTQKQLAERIGTSQAAIARLESGMRLPSVDTLHRLAVVLGIVFEISPQTPLAVRPHRAA